MYLEEKKKGESNREYARRMIRENILRLNLKPGAPISEQELIREMGMSRTPIREAILELERTKIVDILPQKGTYVSYLNYDLAEEARFLRMTLELALIDIMLEKASEEDFQRMEANVAMQKFYLERPNQLQLLILDDEFHRMFFEICDKMECYHLYKSFSLHFDRLRYVSLEDVRDNKTVQDHEDMVRLLRRGQREQAKELLRVHLSRFQADKEWILKEHRDYFKPSL